MNENINQPTYKRQRFLLAFIRQLQCGVTSTDLQKLVFLHTISEGLDFYGFIPYKYGPLFPSACGGFGYSPQGWVLVH